MSMLDLPILFVANPFWDKTAYVSEGFLGSHQVQKGKTDVEFNYDRFQSLWKEATSHSTKENGRSGGSGANAMLAVVKLGHKNCSILGKIGNDKSGSRIEAHLADIGARSLLIKSEALNTGKALCLITPDNERSIVAHCGATTTFTPEEIALQKKYGHWHIEGYAFFNQGIVPKCLAAAKDSAATTSMNMPTANVIALFKVAFQKVAKEIDFIFGDVEEICTLTDCEDIETAMAMFSVDQTVAVTDGPNFCWVKPKGSRELHSFPVPKVDKIINKTGAGDIWSGVYLACALQGKSVELSVELATQAAQDWIQQTPGTYIEERTWALYRSRLL